jgi:hypothetical protein
VHERMYHDLASWFPLLSPPEDYAEEASLFRSILLAHTPTPRTLLELGAGGGHNASHLKGYFAEVTLLDRSREMLKMSARLNPELRHVEGDIRDIRLHERFDAVFIHDAICHMTSTQDLRRALETAAVHTKPGGIVLVAPDETKERFAPSVACGGSDDPVSNRGIRYLEWAYDPDPGDELITVDYAYLLRDADGSVRTVHDRHLGGLFPRQHWLDLLNDVGFEATSEVHSHSELDDGYELFIGRRR